jgi:hypothetical protein
MPSEFPVVVIEEDEPTILSIRGHKVMLDKDLALMYGVETRTLNQAIQRNKSRFPTDFLFQLTTAEFEVLKSQPGSNSRTHGGRRKLPYAFTEHGAVMAASVLNSPRAVEASVFVVRAFVRLRHLAASHKDLAKKLDELERTVGGHDAAIKQLVAAIRQLMSPPAPEKSSRRIGFRAE